MFSFSHLSPISQPDLAEVFRRQPVLLLDDRGDYRTIEREACQANAGIQV
jgi:hypothetical protein